MRLSRFRHAAGLSCSRHGEPGCMLANLLTSTGWVWLALAAVLVLAASALRILVRFFQTLPALALVPVTSRRLSRWVRARGLDEAALVSADGAGEPWMEQRRLGLNRLAARLRSAY